MSSIGFNGIDPEVWQSYQQFGNEDGDFREQHSDPLLHHHPNQEIRRARLQNQAERIQEDDITRFFYKYNFLLFNPLSRNWNAQAIKDDPARIIYGLILWPFGMIGYVYTLPIRIGIFVYTLIKSLVAMVNAAPKGWDSFKIVAKYHLLILGGATGELVSNVIGLVAPPIAYKIEEKIQQNPDIYEYYNSHFLSFWTKPEELGLPSFDQNQSAVSMRKKKEEIAPFLNFFSEAKKELESYHSKEYIEGRGGGILYEIASVGFLKMILKGVSLKQFEDRVLEKIKFQAEKEIIDQIRNEARAEILASQSDLSENVLTFRVNQILQTKENKEKIRFQGENSIDVRRKKLELNRNFEDSLLLLKKFDRKKILNLIISQLVLNNKEDDPDYFKDQDLEQSLQNLLDLLDKEEKDAVKAIASCITQYTQDVTNVDSTMFSTLLADLFK